MIIQKRRVGEALLLRIPATRDSPERVITVILKTVHEGSARLALELDDDIIIERPEGQVGPKVRRQPVR